jgi:hypothetical protein
LKPGLLARFFALALGSGDCLWPLWTRGQAQEHAREIATQFQFPCSASRGSIAENWKEAFCEPNPKIWIASFGGLWQRQLLARLAGGWRIGLHNPQAFLVASLFRVLTKSMFVGTNNHSDFAQWRAELECGQHLQRDMVGNRQHFSSQLLQH